MEFIINIIVLLFLTLKYLRYILKKFMEFQNQKWGEYREKCIMLVVTAPIGGLLTAIIAQIITKIIMQVYNVIT